MNTINGYLGVCIIEELLSVKHALDEKHTELQDKNLLLNTVNQQVTEQENQV